LTLLSDFRMILEASCGRITRQLAMILRLIAGFFFQLIGWPMYSAFRPELIADANCLFVAADFLHIPFGKG